MVLLAKILQQLHQLRLLRLQQGLPKSTPQDHSIDNAISYALSCRKLTFTSTPGCLNFPPTDTKSSLQRRSFVQQLSSSLNLIFIRSTGSHHQPFWTTLKPLPTSYIKPMGRSTRLLLQKDACSSLSRLDQDPNMPLCSSKSLPIFVGISKPFAFTSTTD